MCTPVPVRSMSKLRCRRLHGVLLVYWLMLVSHIPLSSALDLDGSAESLDELIAHWTLKIEKSQKSKQGSASGDPAASTKPNFLVIMSDDQDQLLNSTHETYMPDLHKHIAKRGLQLRSFAVSTTVCCPSRVNFMTGQYAHNNNVTSNVQPDGGAMKFQTQKLDESYLPTWLQEEGYRTYFTGKWLNQFNPAVEGTQCPAGWNFFEPLVAPHVLDYWNSALSLNCGPTIEHLNQYVTDVLLNKTLSYLVDAARHPDKPFLIVVAPTAPHAGCPAGVTIEDGDSCTSAPLPAPRHTRLFKGVSLPLLTNHGHPPVEGTFNWVDHHNTNKGWDDRIMNNLYLARLRSVRAVDEMIGAAVSALEGLGLLDNTYVIFLSDNGFHIGSHGVASGKLTAYEEDVRVPFFIRGPGIPEARISDYQATMCDVPATILDLAGGVQPWQVDGSPLPLKALVNFKPKTFTSADGSTTIVQGQNQLVELRDQIPHEMWVWGSDTRMTKRDYRALRVCTEYLAFGTPTEYKLAALSRHATFGFRHLGSVPYSDPKEDIMAADTPRTCYKYVVWCTGTVELYDLMLDPGEINNRALTAPVEFMSRMDAYMTLQGFCHGLDCYHPYMALHPDGSVTRFAQIMNTAFNSIYAALPRFRFKSCTFYYHRENEVGWYSGSRARSGASPSVTSPTSIKAPPQPTHHGTHQGHEGHQHTKKKHSFWALGQHLSSKNSTATHTHTTRTRRM